MRNENLFMFKIFGWVMLVWGIAHIIAEIFFYDWMHSHDAILGIHPSWCESRFLELSSIYVGYYLISGIKKLLAETKNDSYDLFSAKEFFFLSKWMIHLGIIVFMIADNFKESRLGIIFSGIAIGCYFLAKYMLKKELKNHE